MIFKTTALLFITIFILSISPVFAGGSSDKKSSQGPGGSLMIYTSIDEEILRGIDLKSRFPGCEVSFFCAPEDEIRTRITREQVSRKLGCDMVIGSDPSFALELKGQRMLYAHKSKEASYLAVSGDKDNYFYPVMLSNMVLVYNPEKYPGRSVSESFYDFAYSEAVRGAIAMENPLNSGTSMAALAALRDLYGYEYFEALGNQDLKLESAQHALTKLESGEYRVIMIPEQPVLKKKETEASGLRVIFPDDATIVIPSVIMIIGDRWSSNRNTKAAGIVMDWFLSADGQNYIVGNWMHSSRTNYPKLPYDSITTSQILQRSLPISWENFSRQKAELRSKIESLIIKK